MGLWLSCSEKKKGHAESLAVGGATWLRLGSREICETQKHTAIQLSIKNCWCELTFYVLTAQAGMMVAAQVLATS
jgi:hypothetical protein